MKNRKLVYFLGFLLTFTLAVPALAQDSGAPDPPLVTATSLTLEAVTAATDAQFTVTAVLEDDQGDKLDGQDLKFSFGKDTDDDNVLDTVIDSGGTVTTNSNGYAEYTFTAPSTEGDYDYRAYFDGTQNYDYSAKTKAVTVTGAEVRTTNSSKKDSSYCRIEGHYSLHLIEQFYRAGPKRKSCVFIHTPNRARRWFR